MPGMNGLKTLDKLREKSAVRTYCRFRGVSNHEEDVVTALKARRGRLSVERHGPEDLLKKHLQQAAAGENGNQVKR